MHCHDGGRTTGIEGQSSGNREERHHAQRVEITSSVNLLPGGLLGTHELWRSHHLAHTRERVACGGGRGVRDAEVGDERAASRPFDQDVVGLDVAMDHAAPVRVRQRPGHFLQQPNRFCGGKGSGASDALTQCLPFDEAHDEAEQLGVLLHCVHRDYVGVRESGC